MAEKISINSIYDSLRRGSTALAVVGLGYVGMPIAVAFARSGLEVIGFDINPEKIEAFSSGQDPTGEVGDAAIRESRVRFTTDPKELRNALFVIVAVPTPVNADHTPDLSPLEAASAIVGANLRKGAVICYESTVYPGVTEEVCIPILEQKSNLRSGVDFTVGYSPERINPGDREHRLENIVKIVSGQDEETLDLIAKVYQLVVHAGVHRAESIRVAEAAKVIENSQRDINIAFMNELSIIFHRMGIDTRSVLEAAATKWNFLNFRPGLVGGHCIGVDPYYLTYRAETLGYHSEVILSGRRINDGMGKYVAEQCIKLLIAADKPVKGARVAILGLTFKEDCPDVRNSKVVDIVRELHDYGITPVVTDPIADAQEARRNYQLRLTPLEEITEQDAVIVAVAHERYRNLMLENLQRLYRGNSRVLLDVKGIYDRSLCTQEGFLYWRL